MLHIVKHPQQLVLLERYLQPSDAIMLIESAVYASSEQAANFARLYFDGPVYVLEEDLLARGWLSRCAKSMQVVNMEGWVDLTVMYEKSISW